MTSLPRRVVLWSAVIAGLATAGTLAYLFREQVRVWWPHRAAADAPDPGINFVLRGWNEDGSQPSHDLSFQDVRVRNVPTNIRSWTGGTERYGNSIFVFEIAQLCIAHLGHLHHTLTKQQLDDIGRLDVVLAPVDGTYTLDLEGMMEVLRALNAPLVIPMHYFSTFTLERFLARARQDSEVETNATPSIVLSRATLPNERKVLVLPGH